MAAVSLRYRVDGAIDPAFRVDYERVMAATGGADPLPNPHGARHGIFHNYRAWEYQQVFAGGDFRYAEADNSYYRVYTRQSLERLVAGSGLAPDGDAVLEKRNWLLARKHVNVFLALRK